MLPDISEYYDRDENALSEHLRWVLDRSAEKQLAFVRPRFEAAGLKSVLEFGCGSGLLGFAWKKVDPAVIYTGIDTSAELYKLATDPAVSGERIPPMAFIRSDVRAAHGLPHADLVVAFSFMKHFDLDEWDDILGDVLANGRYTAFDVQIMEKDLDNGVDYHHVFVTEQHLLDVVRCSNHEIIDREKWSEGDVEGHGRMHSTAFWTKRRE